MSLRPILLALALAGTSLAASAKEQVWIEVASPHFTVMTDASAKEGRKAAEDFEQIRAVFAKAFPGARVDPGQPVIILAVKNEKDLKALLPAYWEIKGHSHPAGIFVPDVQANYVALRLDAVGGSAAPGETESPYHMIYHEYFHLLERLNFDHLPLWLTEGLADFYGNTLIQSRQVEIGDADPVYRERLQYSQRIPLETLFTVDPSSPYYNEENRTSIFYAESWELTHYLYLGDRGAHRPMIRQYLSLISRNVDPLEAARQAFGDLNRLAKQLNDYSYRSVYQHYVMKAPFQAADKDFSVRPFSPAESAAIRGDFYRCTNRPVEARAALDEAIRLDPHLAAPYVSQGALALRQGELDRALASFARAAELDPQNYLARYYRAQLSLRSPINPDQTALIESDLREVIRLKPDFPPADRLLARLYASRGERLPDAAELAKKAIDLEPGNLQNHVALGYVLLRMEKPAEAELLAHRLLAAANSPADRQAAQRLLDAASRLQALLAHRARVAAERPAGTPPASPREPQQALERRPIPPNHAKSGSPQAPRNLASPSSIPAEAEPSTSGEGRAEEVACSGKRLDLKLVFEGFPLRLHSEDASKIQYFIGRTQPPASFPPCLGLRRKYLKVEYRLAVGKPYAGEILKIEIQP